MSGIASTYHSAESSSHRPSTRWTCTLLEAAESQISVEVLAGICLSCCDVGIASRCLTCHQRTWLLRRRRQPKLGSRLTVCSSEMPEIYPGSRINGLTAYWRLAHSTISQNDESAWRSCELLERC